MNIYFFCETTAHILTTYFITKIYLGKFKPVVFLQENRPNLVQCQKTMEKLQVWSEVTIAPDLDCESVILDFYKKYNISKEDVFYFYAYHSPADRGLFYLIQKRNGKLIATDEAGATVGRFRELEKGVEGRCFLNLDFEKIQEVWMYDFSTCTIKSPYKHKKIDLSSALRDRDLCGTMQQEVKELFSIQKEKTLGKVVFFDQPLAQVGYISYYANVALLNTVYDLVGKYGLVIKCHPGELHPEAKMLERPFILMENTHVPWEAVYFVNYYGTSHSKMIFMTYASLAVTGVTVMFGIDDICIIFLHNIVRNMLKYEREKLFESADLRLQADSGKLMSAPSSFYELEDVINCFFGKSDTIIQRVTVDKELLRFYKNSLKSMNMYLPNYLTGATLQFFNQGVLARTYYDCWPYESRRFQLTFDCTGLLEFDCVYLSINNNHMLNTVYFNRITCVSEAEEYALEYEVTGSGYKNDDGWKFKENVAVFRIIGTPKTVKRVNVYGIWGYGRFEEAVLNESGQILQKRNEQLKEKDLQIEQLSNRLIQLETEVEKQQEILDNINGELQEKTMVLELQNSDNLKKLWSKFIKRRKE